MCGIAGILRTSDRPLPPRTAVERMMAAVEYRGPDGAGEYRDDAIHIGAVRLAIIDLKGGDQPMMGCSRRVVSVYNGEIYNYNDLRRDLADAGHRLVDECDSTVVPHLYEERGEELVNELRGMYAFAVWDAAEKQLLLARDRIGIKPLYFAQTEDFLVFASEIKSILASGLVEASIDRASLDDLFSLSYPCPPRTMFRDIYEVRPAHAVTIRAGRSIGPQRRYWHPPFRQPGEYRKGSRRDLAHEFHDLLTRSVYDHLRSDVPVATYLSGGLDSSAISSLVREVTGDPPHTFSIGFESSDHDEHKFAQVMVDHLGASNDSVVCDSNIASLFPKMIWHAELPLQFPLALPLMELAGVAHNKGFPVVLTGEGADETMGGYDCFRAQKMRRLFDRPGLRGLRPLVYSQLYKWHGLPTGTIDKLLDLHQRSIADVSRAFSGVYPAWYDNWQMLDIDRDQLLSPDGRDPRSLTEAPKEFSDLVSPDIGFLAPLDRELSIELQTRLPAWILLIGDRSSMANGVEARVPFLDHQVVEFVASLSPSMKMRGFREKEILRAAMKGRLPNRIRRRQKRPFYTPVAEWFFAESRPEFVDDLMSERALRDSGLFAPEVVKRLLQELQLAKPHSLAKVQLEWMLVLILGTQVLEHLFVASFDRGGPPSVESARFDCA